MTEVNPFWVVDDGRPLDFEVVRGDEESVGSSFFIVDGPYDTAADALKAIEEIYADLQDRDDEQLAYELEPNLGGF